MELLLAIFFVIFSVFGPIRQVFSVSIAVSFSLFYYLVGDIATIMFVILFIRLSFRGQLVNGFRFQFFKIHFFIFLLGLISILWSQSFLLNIAAIIAYIKVLIIALVSLSIIRQKEDIKYLYFGTTMGLVYIIIMLIGWKNGLLGVSTSDYQANIDKYGRLLIQFLFPERHTPINSNTWASLVSISYGLIVVFWYYSGIRTKSRRILLFLFGISLVFVISDTGSRAAILGLLISIYLVFKFHPPKVLLRNIGILILIFYFSTFTIDVLLNFFPIENEVILSRFTENTKEDPRQKIWAVGFQIGLENPFLGQGLGNGSVKFLEYAKGEFENKMAMHNSFLTSFVELGILGFILFTYWLFSWQKPLVKSDVSKVLLSVVGLNILSNALAHSFELENYFIVILYATYKYLILENQEIQISQINGI